jgi:hypothetical protein
MDRCQHGRSGANFRAMGSRDQSKNAVLLTPFVALLIERFIFKTKRYGMLHKTR